MNSRQYARIEKLLEQAEVVTDEHPIVTIQGNRIKAEVHELLQKVTTERIRTEIEEGVTSAGTAPDVRIELLNRIREYERIIAALEAMNASLRKRRRGATDSVMVYCDSHVELNERTITTMRSGLESVRKQLALSDGARPNTDGLPNCLPRDGRAS